MRMPVVMMMKDMTKRIVVMGMIVAEGVMVEVKTMVG